LQDLEVIPIAAGWLVKICGAYVLVVGHGMVLGEIVGKIAAPAAPVHDELAFFDAIFYPVKTHVDGFGATLLDSVVNDADGRAVVSDNRRGRLWMAHFIEGRA
jgi:hypothetical protein